MLALAIDAQERCDVMMADALNMFIQMWLDRKGQEKTVMKITGVLVDLLLAECPIKCGPCVVHENRKKVSCVEVLQATHGMFVSALSFCPQFKEDLEDIGFIFNPCDPCVANQELNGKQCTIWFHVDDLVSGHVDKKVINEFLKWLNEKHGSCGEVTATRGTKHNCLGMEIKFMMNGTVQIGMTEHSAKMIEDFPIKFPEIQGNTGPASVDTFKEDMTQQLAPEQQEVFHHFVDIVCLQEAKVRPAAHVDDTVNQSWSTWT